jgi:hypothetical protein
MGMKIQILTPTMQHGEEADLGAEMPRIGGNGAKSLGYSPEENAVRYLLVLIGDGGNLFWQGEDNVEVFDFEKLCLTIFDPLGAGERLAFWTMPIST